MEHGKVEEYTDGELILKYRYKNGKLHGRYREYESGKVIKSYKYKNGELQKKRPKKQSKKDARKKKRKIDREEKKQKKGQQQKHNKSPFAIVGVVTNDFTFQTKCFFSLALMFKHSNSKQS